MEHLIRRRHTLTGVCITGGEPTLQPDLADFIRRIKTLGYLIKLDTNGSDPKLLEQLCKEGLLDYVAMDIKHCPQKYESIACNPAFCLEDIRKSVDLLLKGSIPYEFRTTVTKQQHSLEDMEAIGRWIAGAARYYLQPYRESEAVISPVFTPPDSKTLQAFLAVLAPYVDKAELRGID